ncbi:MAG: hypothetical protein K9I94_03345 [Bacteroidales bacterium]|nr:hypothetical protein [Bacteroidales bacterium]
MKIAHVLKGVLVVMATAMITLSFMNPQQDKAFEKQWKQVEQLEKKGQPRSALEIVENIYAQAKKQNDDPQFLKAVLYRIKLKAEFEEDFMIKLIDDLNHEIKSAGQPEKSVLHSITAEMYWRYYQANRHKILDREVSFEPSSEDLKTWDARQLVNAVSIHYKASLRDDQKAKSIQLKDYAPILEEQKGSKKYRPTLYDFLAHRAAGFFMQEEPGITRPAAYFKFDDEQYLASAGEFANTEIAADDTASLDYQAIKILQELTRFHLDDEDPAPLTDIDLIRLEYVHNKSILSKSDSLYLASLETLKEKNPGHPATARVFFKIASFLNQQGAAYHPYQNQENRWGKKKAHDVCQEAMEKYPDSEGAHNCKILAGQIETTDLRFETEYVNPPGEAFRALASHKNIDNLYGRAIPIDPEEYRQIQRNYRGNEAVIKQFVKMEPAEEWQQKLENEGDFQQHSVEIAIPRLDKGFYVLLLSDNENFNTGENRVAEATCWISNIAYIHQAKTDGSKDFFLLDRNTGEPLKNAKAQLFYREYNYRERQYLMEAGKLYEANNNGFLHIEKDAAGSRSFSMAFYHEDDTLLSKSYFRTYSRERDEKTRIKTHFFTDRGIYRPGQTIYFKGIMIENKGEEHNILPGKSTTVTFHDVNGKKISSLELKTNEYGSFSGSFTAPVGRLTGQMRIADDHGRVYVSVEEYKRPNFEVEFQPITGSYKLNEEVSVTGKAMGYSGNPIINADVKYRVVRTTRFPFFFFNWYNIYPSSPELEIAQGLTQTDQSGAFTVDFKAIPDLQVPQRTNPVFDYRIEASVTDIAGETHSQQTVVSVGYQSLEFDLGIDENVNRQQQDSIPFEITNLNGEPQEVSGTLAIYRLEQPERLIRERKWQRPDQFVMNEGKYKRWFPYDEYNNETDYREWPRAEKVLEKKFSLPADSIIQLENLTSWETGRYAIEINTTDAFGEEVEHEAFFKLFDPEAAKIPLSDYAWFYLPQKEAEPGEKLMLLMGTQADDVWALFEIEHKGEILKREWHKLDKEQKQIAIPVAEKYRGNFGINVVFVKQGRVYTYTETIQVPHSDKKLDIAFATYRNELKPGAKEEWHVTIKDHKGDAVAAEMLTGMYDASLDVFKGNHWKFDILESYSPRLNWKGRDAFGVASARSVTGMRRHYGRYEFPQYDHLNWFGFDYYGGRPIILHAQGGMEMKGRQAMPGVRKEKAAEMVEDEEQQTAKGEPARETDKQQKVAKQPPVRKDFSETAFFYPHIHTDTNGNVVLKFTMPDALTRWNFMGLAHTKDLKFARFRKELVTRKELMVIPNAPRFVRQGDTIQFTTKVVNMSGKAISGTAQLELFDAVDRQPVDTAYQNLDTKKVFTIDKEGSAIARWRLIIPDDHFGALTYRISATTEVFTDIMENTLPVITNRMLITETKPLPVDGSGSFDFTFNRLLQSGESATLKNHRLTLEFTSNPAWYAVQAMPYVMEGDSKNALSIFHRFYANMLASHIVNSNPKIKRVFEAWKQQSPDAFLSNLEKNEELKNVILSETPWVMDAESESERKRRIALLFDLNKMSREKEATLQQLINLQSPNGGWPWFEGMRESRYITQQIVSGFGHLDHLGIDIYKGESWEMVKDAVEYLDERIKDDYERIKKKDSENHVGRSNIQYLYARSYFASTIEMQYHQAFNYFKKKAWEHWTAQNEYLQGMISLALHRYGERDQAEAIITSLKERALHSEEMGMYWRDINEGGYYWHEAGIESQALLIEAFDVVTNNREAVEDMKKWLLKQKQTQHWKTAKATAEAVYALLLHGTDWLAETPDVTVKLGEKSIDPQENPDIQTQAGTGYFKTSWEGEAIDPAMGDITVAKKGKGVAWGAVYWQYFEDLDQIERHETPMKVTKQLFIKRNTESGPVIEPVSPDNPLTVGDELIVRLKIVSDRNMEYVHLKDMRASAFEPAKTLSGAGYKEGLSYYRSTRDAATHFYFDRLPRGTYVFEYPLIVSQQGQFSNGIATIQCLYAPEFAAHSKGIRVEVKE